MQDLLGSKHSIKEKDEEEKHKQHAKGKLKHDTAEALEEHQWHKHPGGG
jgi:hypothetical protein